MMLPIRRIFPNSSLFPRNGNLRFMAAAVALLLVSCWSVAKASAAAVKPQDDFDGYMQQLQRQETEETLYRERIAEHEEWRQTTWGGWAVRTMQALAQPIEPFALAVVDAMKDDDTGVALSPMKLLVYVGLRVYVVLMGLLLVVALSRLLQMFIGTGDIVMEEEVVIVHEHDTEEAAAKARAAQSRGKKQKAQ